MMCSYAGVDFKDENYTSMDMWGTAKAELKQRNPLMNLPFVKDGEDALVTQSNACLMYLDSRLGLEPAEPNLKMRNIQVRDAAVCGRACSRTLCPKQAASQETANRVRQGGRQGRAAIRVLQSRDDSVEREWAGAGAMDKTGTLICLP